MPAKTPPTPTSPSTLPLDVVLATHERTTADLQDALTDLAETNAAIAVQSAQAWSDSTGLGVTERREAVAAHVASLRADAARFEGQVQVHRASLTHLELLAKYHLSIGGA